MRSEDLQRVMASATPAERPQSIIQLLKQPIPPCEPDETPKAVTMECANYELTDQGNALRLVRRYGRLIKYSWPHDAWLVWTGTHWTLDKAGVVWRYAMQVAALIHDEAEHFGAYHTEKDYHDHARSSQAAVRTKHMVELARCLPGVTVEDQDAWDRDVHLLATPSGTIDLRTGQISPPRREDLITRCTPIDYDPRATHPTLTRLLRDLTNGDQEYTTFLRDLFGYSISAANRDKVVVLACGAADTGKSTLMEAVKRALGRDLAATSQIESFMRSNAEKIRSDLARLDGPRIVIASESDKHQRFASGLVKQLSGGSHLTVRHLFGREFEFQPKFVIWVDTNFAPTADWSDSGMRRRLLTIPFLHPIPEERQDPGVQRDLWYTDAGRRAVLAWVIAGSKAYHAGGVAIHRRKPQVVTDSITSYWQDQDPLAEWAEEMAFVADPGVYLKARTIRQAYLDWCENAGRKPVAEKALGDWVRERGGTKQRSRIDGKVAVIWTGCCFADGSHDNRELGQASIPAVTGVTDVTDGSPSSLTPTQNSPRAHAHAPARTHRDLFPPHSKGGGGIGNIGNTGNDLPAAPREPLPGEDPDYDDLAGM